MSMKNIWNSALEKIHPAGYRGPVWPLFSKLFKLGLINTIRFNYHYFGLKRVFSPLFLLSREVTISCMKGSIFIETTPSLGLVTIGLNSNGVVPRGVSSWENVGNIIIKGPCHFGPGTKIVNAGVLTCGGGGKSLFVGMEMAL